MQGLDGKHVLLRIYAVCWVCLMLLAVVACLAKPHESSVDGDITLLAIVVAGPALMLLIIRDFDY
jgi:hypothetical protein